MNAWDRLHRYRQAGTWDATACRLWYGDWLESIPKYKTDGSDCNCHSHWIMITNLLPPDFSSQEKFVQWGFERHNDINAKLGKPPFPLELAWKIREQQ